MRIRCCSNWERGQAVPVDAMLAWTESLLTSPAGGPEWDRTVWSIRTAMPCTSSIYFNSSDFSQNIPASLLLEERGSKCVFDYAALAEVPVSVQVHMI